MRYYSTFNDLKRRLSEPRHFIQVLLGPRQVGKTTGVQAVVQELAQSEGMRCFFHAVDEPLLRDRDWIVSRWEEARQATRQSQKQTLLCFDEIQKVENWSETIKHLWDEDTRNRLPLQLVLLGSSTLLIQEGLSESLAGRFEMMRIHHWLYPEMNKIFGFTVDEWIYFGGYPGTAHLRNEGERWASYVRDSLIETTVSRDVLMIERVDKPALLRRLFQLGALSSGQILSYQKMLGQLQDAGNTTTLAHYLELLTHAGLLTGLQKYSGTELRRRGSSPKFQVFNTSLTAALSGKTFEQTRQDPELWGRRVESAVGAHLLNQSFGGLFTLGYWNEGAQEVDFVLHANDKAVGFEVKSGRQRGERAKGIKVFLKRFAGSKVHLIGGPDGVPLVEFFSSSLARWTG